MSKTTHKSLDSKWVRSNVTSVVSFVARQVCQIESNNNKKRGFFLNRSFPVELGGDYAELGAIFQAFSTNEKELSQALSKTGEAIDGAFLSSRYMVSEVTDIKEIICS